MNTQGSSIPPPSCQGEGARGWGRCIAIGTWLSLLIFSLVLVSRTQFSTDMSAFLPSAPTQEQQLLIDQIKSGVVSRLILIGIEGGTTLDRAQASKSLAARLRTNANFLHIANGEPLSLERDRKILFDNRYLLSPGIDANSFTVAGLHAAMVDNIANLALSAGLFTKALLPHDPTGEFMRILDSMNTERRPRTTNGVWVSRDQHMALLLARTSADGGDTDGQERSVRIINTAFKAIVSSPSFVKGRGAGAGVLRLVMTGPGPFSVAARNTIKNEVARISGLGTIIIVALLLGVYRSPLAIMLGLLPVLSGILAGIVAVSLGFGTMHGITLGFGTALLGEAIDYSIYLFVQSPQLHNKTAAVNNTWAINFWPTIQIGVLTSIIGFASLLFSDFPGLAQLGLYAIAGLVTAAVVTRLVLPHLLPSSLRISDVTAIGIRLQSWLIPLARLRWPLVLLFVVALSVLIMQRNNIWNTDLAALSPVPAADQAMDRTMRADLGAPDVRQIIVVTAPTTEIALANSEQIALQLTKLKQVGIIAGFDSPTVYLPSIVTQQRRLASIPDAVELRQRFNAAIANMPWRAEKFAPFLADVASARLRHPLQRIDIDNTTLAQGVDALLFQANGRWTALLPLHVTVDSGQPQIQSLQKADSIRAAVIASGLKGVYFIDIKDETNRLYAGYLQEAIQLSILGLTAIIVLLFIITRSIVRVFNIITPLAMSAVMVVTGLVLSDQTLNLLHLVGLLLIFAIGSNYSLFFDRGIAAGAILPSTLASLLLATITTVIGFGILTFSTVPILNAIGITVAPGAFLALVFSAIFIVPTLDRGNDKTI